MCVSDGGEARRLEDRKYYGRREAKNPIVTTGICLEETWIEFLALLIFIPVTLSQPCPIQKPPFLLLHLGWHRLCRAYLRLGESGRWLRQDVPYMGMRG